MQHMNTSRKSIWYWGGLWLWHQQFSHYANGQVACNLLIFVKELAEAEAKADEAALAASQRASSIRDQLSKEEKSEENGVETPFTEENLHATVSQARLYFSSHIALQATGLSNFIAPFPVKNNYLLQIVLDISSSKHILQMHEA